MNVDTSVTMSYRIGPWWSSSQPNPFITLCSVRKTVVGNQMQKQTNKIDKSIRFAGDTDIQKLQTGTGCRQGYPKHFSRYFEDSHSWKKLHIPHSFIYCLRKHLFSLLCHGSKSVSGAITVR